MTFRIDYSCEIAAPVALVWEVITDLPAYGEWNPFVVACQSTLQPGDPIRMKVHVLPWFAQWQTEKVFEHVAQQRLCYGLDGAAISSRRCHELREAGSGRTRYDSTFRLTGPISGLVRALLGARLEQGFSAMTDAVRRRAEELARARRV